MASKQFSDSSLKKNPIKPKKQQNFLYVDEESIHHDLKCSICLDPLLEPKMHSCGQMFCSNCIEGLGDCPICRKACSSQGDMLPVPLFVRGQLDELKVLCPDCAAHITRKSLSDHYKSCSVVIERQKKTL